MPKLDLFVRCVVLLGIVLRLTGLTIHSLWYDEAAMVFMATAADPVEALQGSRHPPIAVLLLRSWIALFGEGDAMMRALPALLACGSLLLFTRLAARWCSPLGRALAVTWFALSPFQIWYGQEVTPYAFLEFGAVLAYVGYSNALAAGAATARTLLLVALGTTFAFGAHYLGALAGIGVAAMALLAVTTGQLGRRDGSKLVAATAIAGLAWVPWLATVYWQHQRHTVWGDEARTSLRELAELPVRLLMAEASALPANLQWTGIGLGGLAWVGLLFGAYRTLREPRRSNPAVAALVGAVAVALLLALVAKNFLPRYMTAVAPLVVLVAAEGLAALPLRGSGLTAGTFVALVMALLTGMHRTGNRREDYRAACALVEQRWRPGDAVVAVSGTPERFSQAPLRHYLRARPDILATLREPASWPAAASAKPTGPAHAVHVVYRANSYAEADLRRVTTGRKETFATPVQFKVQYRELQ